MWLKKIKYKILSKILWGKKRQHYKEKKKRAVKTVQEAISYVSTQDIQKLQQDIQKLQQEIKHTVLSIQTKITDSLTAYAAHQKIFPAFKNKYQGRNLVIIGTGPTLNYYKEQRKQAIHIGTNTSILTNLKLDYIFMQDYRSVKDCIYMLDEERFKDTVKFLGRINPEYFSEELMKVIIPEHHLLRYQALTYYNMNIFTQEWQNLSPNIDTTAFGGLGSVVFQAAQFALWTNPAKIYLVGCDCSIGHFNENDTSSNEHLIHSWRAFKTFATLYYPDIEIIVVNPVGLKGIFKGVYTEAYLKDNPEITGEVL